MNNLRNKVQLIGNLGADPEIRKLDNGNVLARMAIATNEVYKNSKGERITETQWHSVVAWGRLAERVENYLHKGSEVALQGKLTHRSFEDNKGNKRYVSEVVLNEFMMLSKKKPEA